MSFSASRRLSDDSLYDPNFPNPALASSSRPRRRSSTSTHSSEADSLDVGEEDDQWKQSVSAIQNRASGTSDVLSPTFQPRATVPSQGQAPDPAELSPTAPMTARMPSAPSAGGGWGVEISPTRTATFRAPDEPAAGPRAPAEIDLESEEEDHLPAFTAPAPSYSPSRSPTAMRSALRASLSIPTTRPTFTSSSSNRPLLSDSSAVNTPTSPSADPFGPQLGAQPNIPPSPQRPGSIAGTPRIHINSIPTSPPAPDVTTVVPGVPVPSASPFGTTFPATYDSRYGQSIDSFSNPSPSARRPSVANTQRSGTTSVTSALDIKGGKLTAAERRNQRMKQVMGKKGSKERAVKGPGGVQINRKPFQSTRLKDEIYKPWLEKKDPAQRWARWITLISILVGLAVMGVICWDGYNSVPRLGNICPVLNEDFSNGIDSSVWTREVRVDGYGHGSFEYTTASNNNSFVQDKVLYLVPTLTSDVLGENAIQNGYTLNLTQDGTCTSTNVSQCVAVSNTSQLTVINPVMSARLTTRMSVNVRYGKVEVVARFPTGDWLWPSISMFPVDQTYGKGPRSGVIDIITGRGNNASYTQRGVDYAQSTLHWGPTNELDRAYMTWGYREQRRSAYNNGFRTFGFEWNENYLWTYIDSRVAQVISLRFDQSFWNRGKFPSTITNTTTGDVVRLTNPWINSNNNNAPFDQPFYLTLSLGVGATDGWFPDGEGGKPWLDNSLSAMSDFWNAKNRWWNAWPSDPTTRGFAIKSVKMWKTC